MDYYLFISADYNDGDNVSKLIKIDIKNVNLYRAIGIILKENRFMSLEDLRAKLGDSLYEWLEGVIPPAPDSCENHSITDFKILTVSEYEGYI